MKVLLYARNIVNQDDIDSFLKDISKNIEKEDIKKWIHKSLKDYIQNDLETVNRIKTFKDSDPDWLKKSVKNGTALGVTINSDFKKEVEFILDYIDSIEDRELSKIYKIKYSEMLSKAKLDFLNNDSKDITPVREYKDGFKWVTLDSLHAFNRETKLMNHCLSTDSRYIKKLESKKATYYSLRNKSNKPHCTIEIEHKQVVQIKGHSDGPVINKYVRYVIDFIKNPINDKYKKVLKDDLINIGCILQKGVLYNIYKLPIGFTYKDDLKFSDNKQLKKLPSNMTVKGNFYLDGTSIEQLPENLTIKGKLYISDTPITTLPENLTCSSLDLRKTNVITLPKTLNIKMLTLSKNITFLPENFTNSGEVVFIHSSIKKLPNNLKVKKIDIADIPSYNSMEGGNIEELPDNLVIEDLDLRSSTIKIVPSTLKVKILRLGSRVISLPNNFTVNTLYLDEECSIKKLPENLKVNSLYLNGYRASNNPISKKTIVKDLIMNGSKIEILPLDLKVTNTLDASYSLLSMLPPKLVIKNIDISHTKNLLEIPDTIKIIDELDASNSNLEKLPDILECETLILRKTKVSKLPKILKVKNLSVHHCENITSLPDNLDLDELSVGPSILELPKQLKVNNLFIGLSEITSLPNDIVIRKKLILPDVFTTIPEGIDLRNVRLDIMDTDVEELPDNLVVYQLIIDDKLKRLPLNLTILSESHDFYCDNTKITELPEGFKSNSSLKLPYVTKFPDNLVVNGSLDLSHRMEDRSRLEFLPNNLTVKGMLDLYLCEKLKSLPSKLKVEEIQLTHLQDGILPDDMEAKSISINKRYNLKLKHIPKHLKGKIKYFDG